jgi:hypothetical protein
MNYLLLFAISGEHFIQGAPGFGDLLEYNLSQHMSSSNNTSIKDQNAVAVSTDGSLTFTLLLSKVAVI